MANTLTPSPELLAPSWRSIEPPIIAIDTPVIFEDEGQEEMGDSAPHTTSTDILHWGIEAHLEDRPEYQVYSNLNVHYHPIKRAAYFSADVMAVMPYQRLPAAISSYRIEEDGPAPMLTVEVLSPRTAQQGDLTSKPKIYSDCGVAEYILVDTTGVLLKERLLLRRLQPDGSWLDCRDPDGGVTSALGFRVIIEDDGMVRVINAQTGYRHVRPREADRTITHLHKQMEEERLQAERRIQQAEENERKAEEGKRKAEEFARTLQAELARLQASPAPEKP